MDFKQQDGYYLLRKALSDWLQNIEWFTKDSS